MQSTSEVKESFWLLVIASLLTLALWFIPFAGVVTWPIRQFVTLLHEAGHALAALATFGGVRRVTLDWSGSGETLFVGGSTLVVASAGYLSTILYGSALLLILRRARRARGVAIFTAVLLLVITVLFGGNLLAWMTGLFFGVGCLLMGLKARPKVTHFVMSFLAVQCVLNALYDLRTLLFLSAYDSDIHTDAQLMANATNGFIPGLVWALGWSAIAIAMLGVTLMVYYRSLRQRAALADPAMPTLLTDHASDVAQPRW
ncbi:MAG TPA: M50 family metallopeptidase [Blastocatellia bacterium]|nr:M50 family metallopeptidase [Blastocatellia bacterium]